MKVSDVQSPALNREMRTCLEDVGAEKPSSSTPNDVDSGVMVHELLSPFPIETALNLFSCLESAIGEMHDHITHFLCVENLNHRLLMLKLPSVPLLTATFRIEQCRFQNHGMRGPFRAVSFCWKAVENLAFETLRIGVFVVKRGGGRLTVDLENITFTARGLGCIFGHTGMTLSHLCRETGPQDDVAPTCTASQGDGHIRCQAVGIVHGEEKFIWNFSSIFRNGLELGLNNIRPLSQHFDVPLFLQSKNREQAVASLFVE